MRCANSGLRLTLRPSIVEPAEQRARPGSEGQRHRQVDAHADRQRRQRAALRRLRSISSMMITTTPMPAPSRSAPSRDCRRARPARSPRSARPGARRGRCLAPGAPWKPKAVLSRSSTGGMTSAPKIDAEHQRHLLPPRRRVDQLAGLEVLQIVVGDRRDAEDHRGHEQGEGHQRLGCVAGHAAGTAPRGSARCRAPTGCRRPTSGCSTRRSGPPCSRRPRRSRCRRSGCRGCRATIVAVGLAAIGSVLAKE